EGRVFQADDARRIGMADRVEPLQATLVRLAGPGRGRIRSPGQRGSRAFSAVKDVLGKALTGGADAGDRRLVDEMTLRLADAAECEDLAAEDWQQVLRTYGGELEPLVSRNDQARKLAATAELLGGQSDQREAFAQLLRAAASDSPIEVNQNDSAGDEPEAKGEAMPSETIENNAQAAAEEKSRTPESEASDEERQASENDRAGEPEPAVKAASESSKGVKPEQPEKTRAERSGQPDEDLDERFKSLEARNEELAQELAQERARREEQEHKARVTELAAELSAKYPRAVGGKQAKVYAELILKQEDGDAKQVEALIASANEMAKQAKITKEFGHSGGDEDNSASGKVEKLAKAKIEKGEAKTMAEAKAQVFSEHPELYQSHYAEAAAS
ncbi:MAG TPA: hypothetical protein VLV83_09420, partial [Acidobacteriota bacterium]|nr:hypothetical protein [Acidobacteriota bacterium]